MSCSPETGERILLAGGSLICESMSPETLVRWAQAAKQGGGHLTVRGMMSPDTMVSVVKTGVGHVTFDVVNYDK